MTQSATVTTLLNDLMPLSLAEIDLSLERIERFLHAYGNPQLRLPPVVHVAGTNGKGSTIAFMRAILEQAGYRVHVYTSPHLMRFNERIVVAGKQVEDADLIAILRDIKAHTAAIPLTFFEATTVAAFALFAKTPADFTLLEVGLGGRLDATNLVDPAVSVITPISMDHTEFLGDSITAIAREKAGIIKANRPVVVAPQPPEVQQVIEAVAQECSAPLMRCGVEWFCDKKQAYRSQNSVIALSSLGLAGAHQASNAATALAALEVLNPAKLTDEHMIAGLKAAHWPARLQRLHYGELVESLPETIELWLDGGHNAAGAASIAAWANARNTKLHVVCGMVNRKDAGAFVDAVAPAVESFYAIDIPNEASSMPAEFLMQAAQKHPFASQVAASLQHSVASIAAQSAGKPAIIMICGSLYLAGRVLEKNG